MKFFDGFLDRLQLNDMDYDDYEDTDDVDDILEDEPVPSKSSFSRKKPSRYEEEEESYAFSKSYANRNVEEPPIRSRTKAQPQSINRSGAKLVPLNSSKGNKVFVIKPQEISESQSIIDFLKEDKVIVINMDGLDIDFAQRIIDFISGACYAIDGTIQPVSRTIFIAAPSTTEVSGDLREELISSDSGVSLNLHTNY